MYFRYVCQIVFIVFLNVYPQNKIKITKYIEQVNQVTMTYTAILFDVDTFLIY